VIEVNSSPMRVPDSTRMITSDMNRPSRSTIVANLLSLRDHGLEHHRADVWLLIQGAAAATVAWVIAKDVFDHYQPFFAPIAALIALNASLGERGLNAIRLLEGVVLGIIVSELVLVTLGGGYLSMGLAILVATAFAHALTAQRIVIAQAGVAAILTISVSNAEAGIERLSDALIGAGVALAFSQVLFSPQPLTLLRRTETAMLERMSKALGLTARALEGEEHHALAEQAITTLRELPAQVIELRRVGRASSRVARRTLVWRSQQAVVVHENENADQLDLLGASCLQLVRVAPALSDEDGKALQQAVRELANVLALLASELDDRETRQRAADRALDVANSVAVDEAPAESIRATVVTAIRIVATDVMVFAGVDLDTAVEAVRAGILEQRVEEPPPTQRGIRGWLKALFRD
jgi:uncharacterized membrane protein YgaE (UPF0421/DUF939 family)